MERLHSRACYDKGTNQIPIRGTYPSWSLVVKSFALHRADPGLELWELVSTKGISQMDLIVYRD